MSAEVIPLIRKSPARPAAAANPPAMLRPVANPRREYSFADLARMLSLTGAMRTQIDYLRDLASQCHMPLPRNPRRFGGELQTGPARIGRKSRWCALEIDAWLDSQRNPPPGGSHAPKGATLGQDAEEGAKPLPAPVRLDMRNRARQLAAGA